MTTRPQFSGLLMIGHTESFLHYQKNQHEHDEMMAARKPQ
jgi:hypothetical protein